MYNQATQNAYQKKKKPSYSKQSVHLSQHKYITCMTSHSSQTGDEKLE